MGQTKAERARKERERREAEWQAEQERVRKLGDLFDALPDGPQKTALKEAMTDRIIDLYNHNELEKGDILLEFLPNDYARKFLDWYFDENGPPTFSEELPSEDRTASPAGVPEVGHDAGQLETDPAESSGPVRDGVFRVGQ